MKDILPLLVAAGVVYAIYEFTRPAAGAPESFSGAIVSTGLGQFSAGTLAAADTGGAVAPGGMNPGGMSLAVRNFLQPNTHPMTVHSDPVVRQGYGVQPPTPPNPAMYWQTTQMPAPVDSGDKPNIQQWIQDIKAQAPLKPAAPTWTADEMSQWNRCTNITGAWQPGREGCGTPPAGVVVEGQ